MKLLVNHGRDKGRSITITTPRYLIGRAPECQLRPHSDEVSHRHAELKVIRGRVVITDLGSARGTRVNGRELTGSAALRTGDVIDIGPLSFTVLLDGMEQAGRPRPRKRSAEDVIASWLINEDHDEEEFALPTPRRTPAVATGATTSEGNDSSRTITARQPSKGPDEDAFELLKARTMQPK